MKKDTLAKWLLACSALAFAYACQPKEQANKPPAQTNQADQSAQPANTDDSYDDETSSAAKPAAAEPLQVIEFEEVTSSAEPTAAVEVPVGACGCTKQTTKKGSSDSDEGSNMGSPTGGDDTSRVEAPAPQEPAKAEQTSASLAPEVVEPAN